MKNAFELLDGIKTKKICTDQSKSDTWQWWSKTKMFQPLKLCNGCLCHIGLPNLSTPLLQRVQQLKVCFNTHIMGGLK